MDISEVAAWCRTPWCSFQLCLWRKKKNTASHKISCWQVNGCPQGSFRSTVQHSPVHNHQHTFFLKCLTIPKSLLRRRARQCYALTVVKNSVSSISTVQESSKGPLPDPNQILETTPSDQLSDESWKSILVLSHRTNKKTFATCFPGLGKQQRIVFFLPTGHVTAAKHAGCIMSPAISSAFVFRFHSFLFLLSHFWVLRCWYGWTMLSECSEMCLGQICRMVCRYCFLWVINRVWCEFSFHVSRGTIPSNFPSVILSAPCLLLVLHVSKWTAEDRSEWNRKQVEMVRVLFYFIFLWGSLMVKLCMSKSRWEWKTSSAQQQGTARRKRFRRELHIFEDVVRVITVTRKLDFKRLNKIGWVAPLVHPRV